MGSQSDRDSGFLATPSSPRGQGWPGATSSIAPLSLVTASILAISLFFLQIITPHILGQNCEENKSNLLLKGITSFK